MTTSKSWPRFVWDKIRFGMLANKKCDFDSLTIKNYSNQLFSFRDWIIRIIFHFAIYLMNFFNFCFEWIFYISFIIDIKWEIHYYEIWLTAQDRTELCTTVHHSCPCLIPWQHPWVPLRQPKPRSQPWRLQIGESCCCCRFGLGCWPLVQARCCQGCWSWCSHYSLQRSHGSLELIVV